MAFDVPEEAEQAAKPTRIERVLHLLRGIIDHQVGNELIGIELGGILAFEFPDRIIERMEVPLQIEDNGLPRVQFGSEGIKRTLDGSGILQAPQSPQRIHALRFQMVI